MTEKIRLSNNHAFLQMRIAQAIRDSFFEMAGGDATWRDELKPEVNSGDMQLAFDVVRSLEPMLKDAGETLDWPSRYRCFGVYGYALNRAIDEARQRKQKVYVFRAKLGNQLVWVTSLDPKGEREEDQLRKGIEEALAFEDKERGVSCGGSLMDSGCFVGELAQRVIDVLERTN